MANIVRTLMVLDERLVLDLAAHRKLFWDRVMTGATRFGDGGPWILLGLLVLAADPINFRVVLEGAAAVALENVCYRLLKPRICRPRPYQRFSSVSCLIPPRDEFSFPSGHTAAAFAVLFTIGLFYEWLFLPLLAIATLIGISRIYLGAHYPSDVLAGALLGIACAFVASFCI